MKKSTKLLLTFIFVVSQLFAQKEQQDLDSLYGILKQMPSFKTQITGGKLEKYKALYEKLKSDIKPGISDYALFRRLSELILPINDNHIDFSQIAQFAFSKENLTNDAFVEKLKQSDAFKNFPSVTIDLTDLEKRLSKKKRNDIEGIYYNNDDELKIGIYRTAEKDKLLGVVLASIGPQFQPGELIMYLQERGNGDLNLWAAGYLTKAFYLNRSERFVNGALVLSNFRKKPYASSFANVSHHPNFHFKQIDTNIQYLKLTNFMATDENKAKAKQFYNLIKDSLTAANVIVDIRNNGGGYYSVSSQFLTLLRRYANPGNVYLLVNNYTVSNAEQFAIKLKALKNVQLLGQRTMGRIAYGQNYGTKFLLPSGKFIITPTDLPGEQVDILYEGTGIPVDIELTADKDWVEQTKAIIQQKSGKSNK